MAISDPNEEYGGVRRIRERRRAARVASVLLVAAATALPALPAAAAAAETGASAGTASASATAGSAETSASTAYAETSATIASVAIAASVRAELVPDALSVADARGEVALRFALAQRGKPYVYGGTGPDSYDCSGLSQRSWRAAGVKIPRTTQQQAHTGMPVPLGQIRLGDLVIFYPDASHVGIYAGHGEVVVAPHAGAVVTIQQMRWMPVYSVRRPG